MKKGSAVRNIIFAFAGCLFLLSFLYAQAQGIEGGLDSWQHYLISRYALKYPDLLLDQWNKPVFTWMTVWVCQGGIQALVWFNIMCTLLAGLFSALVFRRLNAANAWMLIPMTVFCPVMLGNTLSGLTEPLNALMLVMVVYLYMAGHLKTSVILASFLPYVRTEGFVICSAIAVFLLFRKQYSLLPWLLAGSLVMNLAGFAITGEAFWIISSNPYWKFEQEGNFDPGNGSILHYVLLGRNIFGLPLLLLFLIAHFYLFRTWFQRRETDTLSLLSVMIFWAYFGAHSLIYYLGILGSHGLTRVMAVVSPVMAMMAFGGLNKVLEPVRSERFRNALYMLFIAAVIWVGYGENDYAKPYKYNKPSVKSDKSLLNFKAAGEWLKENDLMDRCVVHQSPYFNVEFGKDPYDPSSSYYAWSIDQKNDWSAPGTIVIWDGFSAVREGNLKKEWLLNNPSFRLIHRSDALERPDHNPEMYDILIFEKIK